MCGRVVAGERPGAPRTSHRQQLRGPRPPRGNLPPRYNAAPSQDLWAIRQHPDTGDTVEGYFPVFKLSQVAL
jgi:putative SOS response-associated peptidase YedK